MRVVSHVSSPMTGDLTISLEELTTRSGRLRPDRGSVVFPRDFASPLPQLGTIVQVENLGADGCRLQWDGGNLLWTEHGWQQPMETT